MGLDHVFCLTVRVRGEGRDPYHQLRRLIKYALRTLDIRVIKSQEIFDETRKCPPPSAS